MDVQGHVVGRSSSFDRMWGLPAGPVRDEARFYAGIAAQVADRAAFDRRVAEIQADPEVVAAGLPNARIRVLDGQAHVAQLTAPGVLAREVLRFLEEEGA